MKILSIDLGKTSAFWCEDSGAEFMIISLMGLHETIIKLVELYKPDVIIYPHPVRYYNVYRKHWQYIGIINLVAEDYDITTVEVKDSTAKKTVIGSGKATKQDIMDFYGESSEHIADARMFVDWYRKGIK